MTHLMIKYIVCRAHFSLALNYFIVCCSCIVNFT